MEADRTGEGTNTIDYLHGYQDGFKAGIKEVVDWLNINWLGCRSNTPSNIDEYVGVHLQSWQAKLKEWDIE